MPGTLRIHGPGRLLCGTGLLALAVLLLVVGWRLDWGVAWTAWIGAASLLLAAPALLERRRLRLGPEAVEIETGWLVRHQERLPLAKAEVEIVITASLRTVLLHHAGGETVLASWLTPSQAERLCQGLGDLPRRCPRLPVADR